MISLEKLTAGHEPDESTIHALQSALLRYCLTLTQSPCDADDLAQDTWVKALDYMNLHSHPNPEALLLRIAKNTWIDIMRRKATLARVLEIEQCRTEEAHAHSSFEIEAAFQALREHLSPLQQAVFLLRDVFGHSAAEAADILDTTEGAVKAALHRARQALADVRHELLQADGPATPQNTDLQITLTRLAAAYEHGEINELMELVLADESLEPIMAISGYGLPIMQDNMSFRSGGFNSMGMNYNESGMRMAA